MKITPTLLLLSLAAPFSLRAVDETKPADAPKTEAAADSKASPADAAWKELESMLKGPPPPKERPKTREETQNFYKKHFTETDEKAQAFLKAYPDDARRWKVKMYYVQSNSMRQALKLDGMSKEEAGKAVAEILEAKDADKETKGVASYMKIAEVDEKDEGNYRKLAEAHLKAYPDFRGNKSIQLRLTAFDTKKMLKEKPLELKFTAVDGTEVDISKMRGKVVLVDFWATWCGPCVREIPNVVGTYKKLHDKGFEIVGVSFDREKEKLEKMTKDKEMTWVQYYDGLFWDNKFGQQFGIGSIPAMWLVNKKGMVVDMEGRDGLEERVEKLLAE